MEANYRIITTENKVKFAGTNKISWLTLEMAKIEANLKNGDMIYEYNKNGERLWQIL